MTLFTFLCLTVCTALSYAENNNAHISFQDITMIANLHGDEYNSSGGHGLGVNWVDINNDGWDDLFVVGGGPAYPPKLYLNQQDGTFQNVSSWLPQLPAVEMSGSRFADFDNDGDKDLYIYTDHPDFLVLRLNDPDGPPNLLLVNQLANSGSVEFTEQADQVGISDLAPTPFGFLPAYRSKTASWLDYNRDGCIDLFVGHLVQNSAGFDVNKDRFYRNNCDGTFVDSTGVSGINDDTESLTYRAALASGGFHLNEDGWPDLYVVNVTGTDPQPYLNDFLYLNQGSNGSINFIESISQSVGVGNDSQAGMGIDVADVNHDGYWDIYISDIYATELDEPPLGNVLYMGSGNGQFSDNSAKDAGVQANDSWGVNFFDANHDTWEDLFVATIATIEHDFMFLNNGTDAQGQVSFSSVTDAAGINAENARGSAVSDFDHDGDLDIAVVNQGGGLQLFENVTSGGGNWLIVKLEARESNRDAIGAIVTASTGKLQQKRQVKGGSSAHSQDSLNVHFGLSDAKLVDLLKVDWPSGRTTVIPNVSVNGYITVVEADDLIFKNGYEL